MLTELIVLFFLVLPFAYDYSPTIRYYARFYVYYGYVMVAAVLLLPVMALRPRDVDNLILASRVCRVVSRLIGLHWQARGLERFKGGSSCVIIANHQSSLDILGMFEIWEEMGRVSVVAKKELMFAGPFGIAARLCDLIFIDRKNPDTARQIINSAVKNFLAKKTKLWVFPEGTRRNTGTIHPFKKGAFHVAIANQIPIVPIVFSRYYFLNSREKTFDSGEVILEVLPAIETKGLTSFDTESLMERARNDMLNAFTCYETSISNLR